MTVYIVTVCYSSDCQCVSLYVAISPIFFAEYIHVFNGNYSVYIHTPYKTASLLLCVL